MQRLSALNEDLRLLDSTRRGLIVTSDAREFGISDKVIRRLERDGDLLQLSSGVYADRLRFEAASSWERFGLRSRAWTISGRRDASASDFSAAAILGLPMWGEPPDLPRVLRPGSAHRGHSRTPNGRIRFGWLPPHHRWPFSSVAVTSAAYACIDVIRMGSRLQGLTVGDYALAVGITPEQLWDVAENLKRYKGMQSVEWVLSRADRRSESPVESAGRLACLTFGLPEAVANPWIIGGAKPRRVDLLLPEHGIVLEADGQIKYNDRPDAATIVMDQNDREREIRDLDFDVLRFDAALAVGRPAELAGRLRRMIARRRGRRAPDCWSMQPPPGWSEPGLGQGWPDPTFRGFL
ncbi:hypothetical protein SAMN04515671_0344 [Nakamurella panacisegetis]|uniref:AbiEi antitoxin N-terminal domain-containing protein n=1 Tax=Nakamurella panacisegetis TaxID=1090615 RepID=A0A1H0I3T6_9ACTN|nr:type IV toxin-antitoxin system AbiEi family antitoxin domain-containing protein [Nakamurella panacisegetis]SDO26079.1 hypothetical protein SAMN04515671_0344 [Nakamurella panacisegetis]